MNGLVFRWVSDRWTELCPGAAPISSAIVIGIDRAHSAKVTSLFFDAEGRTAAVAKIARTETADPALAAEHAMLCQLQSRGGVPEAPRPFALERVGGRLVLLESPVAGTPMTVGYYTPGHTSDRDRVAADFAAAFGWLRSFQQRMSGGSVVVDAPAIDEIIGPVARRYRASIGWSTAEAELFDAVRDRANELIGTRLPLCARHGDFWMGNLLVSGESVVGVVDWELGVSAGYPFGDVYKFPNSYGFYLDRARPTADGRVRNHPGREDAQGRWRRFGAWPNLIGFGHAWFGEGWFPELVRRAVSDHLEAMSVPAAANAVFFPLFLAEQAMTLDVPAFRSGYRSLLNAFQEERSASWLWCDRAAGLLRSSS